MNQLILVANGGTEVDFDIWSDPFGDDHSTSGFSGGDRLYYFMFSTQDGSGFGNSDAEAIAREFVSQLQPSWLRVESEGRLAASDSVIPRR